MSGIIGGARSKSGIIETIPYSVITYSGYVVYKFSKTGSHTFDNPESRWYQILLVAGGGSGGNMGWGGSNGGGGGGAGGVCYYQWSYLQKGPIPLHVGAGGVSRNDQNTSGTNDHHLCNTGNGENTWVDGLKVIAIGGGVGGGDGNESNQNGGTGGSGGGGGNDSGSGGTGTTNQGYNGSGASYSSNGYAGGGGGANQAGASPGQGGQGFQEGSSRLDCAHGTNTTTVPANFQNGSSNTRYAGGGSSGRWTADGQLTGGAGGGGAGGAQGNNGTNGTDGLGGGGGGGSAEATAKNRKGGNGGSGVILMRYAT